MGLWVLLPFLIILSALVLASLLFIIKTHKKFVLC